MLGYSESELNASLAVSDMLHPDDVAHARTVMRQVTTGETQSVDLPVRFIHKVSHSVVPVVASLMQIEKVHLSSPSPSSSHFQKEKE